MNFTVVIAANQATDYLAEIHRAGCADLDRKRGMKVNVTGTLRDALDVAVDEDDRDMGYDDTAARVFPCTSH